MHLFRKIFGLPILAAVTIGYLFPYPAMEASRYAFLPLAILMVAAGLQSKEKKFQFQASYIFPLCIGLLLVFITTPLLQFFLAGMFLHEPTQIFGCLFAAMSPVAIVAPYFSKLHGGDEALSYWLMIVSHLLSPLAVALVPLVFPLANLSFDTAAFYRYQILLVAVPAVFVFFFARSRALSAFAGKLNLGLINLCSLTILIYLLFGNASNRLNVNYLPLPQHLKILGIVFFQDFGTYFLLLFFLKNYLGQQEARTLAISTAMKNTAISAAILLFHAPLYVWPAALSFIAHAAFFNFLSFTAKDKK